jgi:hypothetical protein
LVFAAQRELRGRPSNQPDPGKWVDSNDRRQKDAEHADEFTSQGHSARDRRAAGTSARP